MKKILFASAMALAALSGAAQADITITQMDFGGTYAASGTLNAVGTGSMSSIDPFFGQHWTATQLTGFVTNTSGSFMGAYGLGAYDFSEDIANMTDSQIAVGLNWNWNTANGVPVLAIFNCVTGICTGAATGEAGYVFGGMQTGPFIGSNILLNGTDSTYVSEVPVPAAIWLFGSGFLGLVGVARSRKSGHG